MSAASREDGLGRVEFVALLAMLVATVAFSIDAMLPALDVIAGELTPDHPNRAQLVLTSFVLGMGIGTFFTGPLSDAIGRKPTIIGGLCLYAGAALVAAFAQSLETLLLARLVQGLGTAGPRVASLALVRDLFEGRRMAQIMSFVMMVFVLVPAAAPYIGSLIIPAFGWRGVFGAFILFALIGGLWLGLRQGETLPKASRRPFRPGALWSGLGEVVGHRMVRLYIACLTLGYGTLFAMISSIQQIYAEIFGKAESFPLWFMLMAILSGAGTLLNATLVMRLGMRRLAIAAYAAQSVLSAAMLIAVSLDALPGALAFPVFFVWSVSIFFMAGLTFGNLNALALQPMGHIAGMASSVTGAISTIGAVAIAVPVGLAFDGTIRPLLIGVLACSALAWWLLRRSRELDPEPKKSPGRPRPGSDAPAE